MGFLSSPLYVKGRLAWRTTGGRHRLTYNLTPWTTTTWTTYATDDVTHRMMSWTIYATDDLTVRRCSCTTDDDELDNLFHGRPYATDDYDLDNLHHGRRNSKLTPWTTRRDVRLYSYAMDDLTRRTTLLLHDRRRNSTDDYALDNSLYG